MPCNKPYTAYRSRNGKSTTGKHPIVFNKANGLPGSELKVRCGQCWGCRLEHSRLWALRNVHESKLHDNNQYLTLTYNDDEIPTNRSLFKPHLQRFWKRLRKHGYNIRYYACGEYGDETERPHYHAIVFNLDVPDKKYYKAHNGNKLYQSQTLNNIWSHGNVIIGNVTFESCAYVSRYIMKKWKARSQYELDKHYERINKSTGEIYQIEPEYQTMSRNPGIGKKFYDKYKSDFYQDGTDGKVTIRGGIQCSTPIFYDSKFESESETNFLKLETIKLRRREHAEARAEDNTPSRLNTKESILRNKINKQLPRKQQ